MASIFWSLPAWLAQDRVQGSWWALQPVVGPQDEPVTIGDVKKQARADGNSYDDISFAGLLVAARLRVEKYTNRSLLPQTWCLNLQTWPQDRIFLPRAPLIGLDWLQYTDLSQATYTVDPSTYTVNLAGDPGSAVLRFGQIWPPNPLSPSQPIRAQFRAGYPRVSGLCSVDSTGLIVTDLSSPGQFDPTWTPNQWITLAGQTSVIAGVVNQSQVVLSGARSDLAGKSNQAWNVNLVPQSLKLAIMMLATHWYGPGRTPVVVGRGVTSADISLTVKSLMDPYRINVMGFSQNNSLGVPILP